MEFNRRNVIRGVFVTELSAAMGSKLKAEGTTIVPSPEKAFEPDTPKPFKPGRKTHRGKLPAVEHERDVCVVGGGMGGLLTAISAVHFARRNRKATGRMPPSCRSQPGAVAL